MRFILLLTKDVYANAIEALLSEKPNPPALLMEHSLDKIRDQHPVLTSFIANVTAKMGAGQERLDLLPAHAFFGLESGPTSILEFSLQLGPDSNANNPAKSNTNTQELSTHFLLVGLSNGTCSLFSLDSFKMIGNLFGNPVSIFTQSGIPYEKLWNLNHDNKSILHRS